MKRVTTGLVGLGLAASLGFAYASPGSAQPTPAAPGPERVGGDNLPNPLETKRQALRDTAITSVLNGDAKPVTKNGTSVVKVGRSHTPADAAALANQRATTKQRQAAQGSEETDQYVELAQERSDKIFVILAEFGNERAPRLPRPRHRPEHPGPGHLRGTVAQRDPRAGPVEGQHHRLAGRLRPQPLPEALLR